MYVFKIFIFILFISNSCAQYLQVNRIVRIKETPSRNGVLVEKVSPGEYLILKSPEKKNGYYHVAVPDSQQTGWVYSSRVKKVSYIASDEGNSAPVMPRDVCEIHLRYGVPYDSDKILCRAGYALGYNYSNKTADWVVYRVTKNSVHGFNYDRLDNFVEDEDIPKRYRSTASDYDEPVYDRGHMAPSEAIDFSRLANDETFYYSNMVPQLDKFNRHGLWKKSENLTRKIVISRMLLYVIAGTHYEGSTKSIGGNKVRVPSHFYKIIYDPVNDDVIAFWFPHTNSPASKDLKDYIKTIKYIENKTGHRFLEQVEDELYINGIKNSLASYNKWIT